MSWNADQLARLARLSDECLNLPPAQRSAWLAQARAEHADIAVALDAMAASSGAASEASPPALTLPADTDHPAQNAGDEVGPYRLVRPLGEGGMGVVWLAEQVDGRVHREVALKLLAPQLAQAGWRLRFERERDILAAMAHPGIARLIDAGVSAQGHPYLAMDFVAGQDIVSHARSRALDPRACVELMLALLEAVQHAHAALVVHRDLKPSNVLVDEAGRVVLLDFGIAKLLQADGDGASLSPTDVTSVVGAALTLDYASPEQVAGRPVGVGTDVYSAGVLLFELLSGQRPYRLQRSSRAAMEEAILEQDLARPSQRVDAAWAKRLGWTARRLSRQLQGDLDAIVMKALQREPGERYASADAFADDLRRWLDGRPVRAQAPSRWYLTRRLVARHRWAVAGVALTVSGLATGLAVAMWQAGVAREEARSAKATEEFLVRLFRANGLDQDSPAVAQLTTARMLLERGSQRIASGPESGLDDAPDVRLRLLENLIGLNSDLGLASSVDDLQQQRLALVRQHRANDLPILANALIAAGRAASTGNTRVADAPKLLDEAEQVMNRAGVPPSAPMRGHLALGRMEVASEDQCAAWKHAQQAVDLLRPVAGEDRHWLEALIGGTKSGAYCGSGEQALALGREALAIVYAQPRARSQADHAHHAMSLAYARMGRLGDSIREAQRSLAFARAKHPADQPSGADVLNAAADLADKFCEYAHPVEALALSVPLLQRIGTSAADLDGAVSLMIRQARAQRQLLQFSDALITLDRAVVLMRDYEVDPAQRALLLDVRADALSASGRFREADRVFEEVARLKDQLNHTGTPQNNRHLARRAEHELRQGHAERAAALIEDLKVKDPGPGKSTRRHMELLLLKGELALLRQDRTAAEALAREALARHDLFAETALARDHKVRALDLVAKVTRHVRGADSAKLVEESRQLRDAMTRPGSFS